MSNSPLAFHGFGTTNPTRAGAASTGAGGATTGPFAHGQLLPDGSVGFFDMPLTFHPYFPVTAADTANGSEVPKSLVGPTRSKNSKRRAQTRSRGTNSQMSSQVLSTEDSNRDDSVPRVFGKKDLSEQDRENFNRAFDLLVLEILTTDMGWEPSPEFHECAKECLVQAGLEGLHETQWDSSIGKLFTQDLQTLRSKLGKASEEPGTKFCLAQIVDPDGVLELNDRFTAVARYREKIVDTDLWKDYFLHHNDAKKGFSFFANPVLCDFHVNFWYGNSSSPVSRLLDEVKGWTTTPLIMLATSASAVRTKHWQPSYIFVETHLNNITQLTYGLRRATNNMPLDLNSKTPPPERRNIRFCKNYNRLAQVILTAMKRLEIYGDEIIEDNFKELLFDLHQRGLRVLDREPNPIARVNTTFCLPSVAELRAAYPHKPQPPNHPETLFPGGGPGNSPEFADYGNEATGSQQWFLSEGFGL